jgi:cell division protein FtsB
VLGKFADLPQEVEAEIRGLDEARRRIAELERQIKKLRSSTATPEIDQAAIERAVSAVIIIAKGPWSYRPHY